VPQNFDISSGGYATTVQALQTILRERAAKNSHGHSVRSPTKPEPRQL
jgi:hypothetical protein